MPFCVRTQCFWEKLQKRAVFLIFIKFCHRKQGKMESSDIKDKALLDLCLDVIYHQNMKALGLHNLVLLYVDWKDKKAAEEAAGAEPDAVND